MHDRISLNPFQGMMVLKEGKVVDVNDAIHTLTGYSRDEFLNETALKKCLPASVFKSIFNKYHDFITETSIICRDQKSLPVELECQIFRNDESVKVLIFKDISERKKIQEELNKFSIALDQSANEVIITRNNGEIEYVNKSFTLLTGYTFEEVAGQNPRILKSGEHSKEFYENLWKTLRKGKQWKGEFHNRKKNGELYWEAATITPVKNEKNEVVRFIAIKEDITLRKKAEQSLIESEEKFRSMVSNLPGVVYRCAYDEHLTVLYITDAIGSLTGYQPSDFQGNRKKTLSGIIHPDDRHKVQDAIEKSVQSRHQFNLEYRILNSSQETRWVSNSGKPVFNPDHSIKWLDGFLSDITERVAVLDELKKAKQSAEEANHAKSEFLANISHEIRTPLNSVLGFTELLEGLTIDSTQVKYLNSIKSSGKNLMILINDLLDLSKIEAGKMTLHFSFFDIRRMLDEIRNIFSLRVTIKGIGYLEQISKNFPVSIKFDEVRLRQILINLIGNAVKFTHEGEIRIKIKAYPKHTLNGNKTMKLEIRVIDTGIGIPRDAFRMIFESFRQHSQLNSRKYGGTGLGLAITKRLVEAMNGTISLNSVLGEGSTFTVVFPDVEYADNQGDTDFLFKEKPLRKKDVKPRKKDGKKKKTAGVSANFIDETAYSEIMHRFNDDLIEQWKMFESKQPLKEIQLFAQDIISLGKAYQVGIILDYGEQLMSTIENFDIEEMRLKLDYFPDLLKQLKKVSHESR
jgi:PAS domain S-box-containing protein